MEPLYRLLPNLQRININVAEKAILLGQNRWLNRVDWSQIELLAYYVDLYSIKKGEVIFRQGDDAPFMAIVQGGKIEVKKEGHAGDEQTIALIGEGHIIGEMSLIDGAPRSASAITAEESKLFILTDEDFQGIRKNQPSLWGALLVRFIKTITQRLRRSSGQFVDLLAEHGAIENDVYEKDAVAKNGNPDLHNPDAQFLWKELNILNNQVAKIGQQITHRLQDASEDTFSAKSSQVTIDPKLLAEVQQIAQKNNMSAEKYINHVLARHLKFSIG